MRKIGLFVLNSSTIILFACANAGNPGVISGGSTSSSSSATGPLIYYYKFDEGSASTATDSSGNKLNGSIGGGVSWVTGKVNTALNFPGTGYVNISTPSMFYNPFSTQQATIQAWVNLNSTAGTQTIVNFTQLLKLEIVAGKVRASIYYNNTWTTLYTSVATLTTGTWTHIAFTYNGGGKLYLNGALEGSGGGIYTLSLNLWCAQLNAAGADPGGCNTYSSSLNGILDELYIYNVQKSASEISAYYGSIP